MTPTQQQDEILDNRFASTAFGAANTTFFYDLCARREGSLRARRLLEFLARRRLFGPPERVAAAWRRCAAAKEFGAPKVEPIRHLFPVFVKWYGVGMVVPVIMQPAEDWSISDAFGCFDDGESTLPIQGLTALLQRMEKAGSELRPARELPLRWRRSFAMTVGCSIHFDAIEGPSLQVPLALALLREYCAVPFSNRAPARLPFGEGPVFASGDINANGEFDPVGALAAKLEAFVREAGEGRPAVLTARQIEKLKAEAGGADLLGRVLVVEAGSLRELLALGEFREGLDRLSGPPHPTEVDAMLAHITKLDRGVRFRDSTSIARWLLPHVESATYQLRALLTLGMNLLHEGSYLEGCKYLRSVELLCADPATQLGADDRARAIASIAVGRFDMAEPEAGLDILAEAPEERHCSLEARVRVLGTRCQLLRFAGRLDQAVEAGERAVEYARQGFASETGRDINYLVHALLRRAAAMPSRRAADLERARTLLEESAGEWAPIDNDRARSSHLGFCRHYQAEHARLAGVPHDPGTEPPWKGAWGHPRLFVLAACARNRAHTPERRAAFAAELVRISAPLAARGGLFRMFHPIYSMLDEFLRGGDLAPGVSALRDWCREQKRNGAPAWEQRLAPFFSLPPAGAVENWLEALFDAVPYH